LNSVLRVKIRGLLAIWAEVAMTHPSFTKVALEISREGAAKLGIE